MKKLELHVHDDIRFAAEWYNIPLAFWNLNDVYILQEDRIVWIGSPKVAEAWINKNKGKYIEQIPQAKKKKING